MLVIAALACSLPGVSGSDPLLEETRVALAVQQTSLANQQATLDAPTLPPPAATYTLYPVPDLHRARASCDRRVGVGCSSTSPR